MKSWASSPWKHRTRKEDDRVLGLLGPNFVPGQHQHHVALLVGQLRSTKQCARNIAVTGHYGSGKSSILGEVVEQLNTHRWWQRGKHAAINVSLSSLGADEVKVGRLDDNGKPRQLTNLIQKEIVKQLLYRARPNKTRGSRYRRTDAFHPVVAAAWALVVAVALGVVALFAGVLSTLRSLLLELPQSWVADRGWLVWIALCVLVLAMAVLLWAAAGTLHNRVWIEKLSAGPATVSLQNVTSSYFDEYLDEVVYFFQASRTDVVVFEDLDRFKDPHIFETLRELNTILNNSEQVTRRPIRFVYAISDSIFERLVKPAPDSTGIPTNGEAPGSTGSSRRQTPVQRAASELTDRDRADLRAQARLDATNAQREASTNRTKFFDLVIPVVPFITHRNARSLLREVFAGTPEPLSDELLDVVGPHLTDMRLLKNIHNEYQVFAEQVLFPNGPMGLKPDRLLAMVIYKNLHMGDFELVREGRSNLDTLYAAYRSTVAVLTQSADQEARQARLVLGDGGTSEVAARIRGEKLTAVLDALSDASGHPGVRAVHVGGQQFTPSTLGSVAFWHQWTQAASGLVVEDLHGGTMKWGRSGMESLLGFEITAQVWQEESWAELDHREQQALGSRRWLARATLSDLIAEPDARTDPERVSLTTLAEDLLDPVPLALVRAGLLLDENYTHYVARFHTGTMSLRAMNFVLHAVQEDDADIPFTFDSPTDIDAIVKEEPRRFLEGKAALNVEVFDHLLATDPGLLGPALDRIASGDEPAPAFMNAYLQNGTRREALISALTPRWGGIFTYLGRLVDVSESELLVFLDAAMRAAPMEMQFEVTEAAQSVIQHRLNTLPVLTEADVTVNASAVVATLQNFDIVLPDLGALAPSVREQAIILGLYPVTVANLHAALGDDARLQLDAIKRADPDVYAHVLRHLDEYVPLVMLRKEPTLSRADHWLGVLVDVATLAPDLMDVITEQSAKHLVVTDLQKAAKPTWPTLVADRRIAPTASNLADYIAEFGVDNALRSYIRTVPSISPSGLADSERRELAVQLINSPSLDPARLTQLVANLETGRLPLSALESSVAAPALPQLVAAGLVEDAAENFGFLDGQPWAVKAELIGASPRFDSYLHELELTTADLDGLAFDREVPDAVRARLLRVMALFHARVSPGAATQLASWAGGHMPDLNLDTIALLAHRGARQETLIALLRPHLPRLGLTEIERVLTAIGEPYAELTVVGDRHHVLVANTPAVIDLLEHLARLGTVSSYTSTQEDTRLRVHRRLE